jgi:hypothetical protein
MDKLISEQGVAPDIDHVIHMEFDKMSMCVTDSVYLQKIAQMRKRNGAQ